MLEGRRRERAKSNTREWPQHSVATPPRLSTKKAIWRKKLKEDTCPRLTKNGWVRRKRALHRARPSLTFPFRWLSNRLGMTRRC